MHMLWSRTWSRSVVMSSLHSYQPYPYNCSPSHYMPTYGTSPSIMSMSIFRKILAMPQHHLCTTCSTLTPICRVNS